MKTCCKTVDFSEVRARKTPRVAIVGALLALLVGLAMGAMACARDGPQHEEKQDAMAQGVAPLADSGGPKEVVKEIDSDSYQCPMNCEGDKVYSKPGVCPVCNMHLKRITTDKFSVEVKPSAPLQAGKAATLVFAIKDPQRKPVQELEVVHEKIMHLLIVSKDLSWYAHEHPERGKDGTFTLSFVFPSAGEYVFYHDFTPPAVGQQVVQVPIVVPGRAPAPVALEVDADRPKQVDGYTFTFNTKSPLMTDVESELIFTVTKDGKPVTDLQPYLGAMGHFVIISQDLENFVHSHPHETGEEAGHSPGEKGHVDAHGQDAKMDAPDSGGPAIHFHAHFRAPGLYKGWGQFQHQGKILTVPVVMQVKEGSHAPSKEGGDHKH